MSSGELPPAAARGGFVGRSQVEAYDKIDTAQQAVAAAYPVAIETPSATERAAGVVVHFRIEAEGYEMYGDVSRGDVGLVITRAELRADLPAGVTVRLLRAAPLTEVLNAVRAHEALEQARQHGTRAVLGQEPAAGVFTPDPEIPKTSGRTPITDELLRAVALAYLQETAPGKDRRAVQRMAARFDRPEGTVRAWIGRARQDGWLGPGAKGRMGAEPGPKLDAYVGNLMRDAKPARERGFELAKILGVEKYGALNAGLRGSEEAYERSVATLLRAEPAAVGLAAQLLWGRTIEQELIQRQHSGSEAESALTGLIGEIEKLLRSRGLAPDGAGSTETP